MDNIIQSELYAEIYLQFIVFRKTLYFW